MIPTRLSEFQRTDLPASEVVGGRIGYPHEAFMCFDYDVASELPADGADVAVLVEKGGRSEAFRLIADHPGRVVAVAAPGDAPFRGAYLPGGGLPDNVVALYATSNLLEDDRVTAVPLGVRTSNVRPLKFVRASVGRPDRDLLLGNFTVNEDHYRTDRQGRPHVRARLAEQLGSASWARLDIAPAARTDASALLDYYAQIARHRFVLSPEGNGIDCYRHWEALSLGAIPIVMRSRAMAPFESLPLLFTDDYSELAPDYLEQQWTAMTQRTFDLEPLLMSSYRRHFLRSVAQLTNPRFVCLESGGGWSPRFLRALRRSPRSGTPAEVEVPVPPFLRPDSLADPRAWRVFDEVSVKALDDGLAITAAATTAGRIGQRFPVVEGVRFRVSGSASGDPARVTVSEAPAGPEIASAPLGCPFELEFEAPSGRLWLQLVVERAEPERTVTLHSVEVAALV